jgi:sporulation protein YlmC with PRC-barrel domain
MTRIAPFIVSFSLVAFAGAAAAAGESQNQGRQQSSAQSQSQSNSQSQSQAMSAKRLIGTEVVDAQGKDMGEINEIVLDLHGGRVHAAVVQFGGFLGVGDKQYAFPVSELTPAKESGKLALNVSKDNLEQQQGFEKDKWPAMNDEYWGRIGGKAAAGGTKAQGQKRNLHRASELLGSEVQNKDGRQVGEISDIVLSSDRGRIQHLVVARDGGGEARIAPKQLSLGTGDKLVVDMPAGKGKQGSAAGGASAGKRTFSELDKDNDGALSQLEAAGDANARSNFEKLDENNDMKLSREEWEAGQDAGAGKTK